MNIEAFSAREAFRTVISVSAAQPAKALSPRLVRVAGSSTSFSRAQPWKALAPMAVTPAGMSTWRSRVSPLKASASMAVTPAGISTSAYLPLTSVSTPFTTLKWSRPM